MPKPYLGAAHPLPAGAVEAAAMEAGCEPAAIRALIRVEASGRWFDRDGTLPRKFEPHHLPDALQARIKWVGGWKVAAKLSLAVQMRLWHDVAEHDLEAACRATSWGGPQIMGFNAQTVGYDSALDLVQAFADDAQAQLDAMLAFLRASGGLGALRAQDWREVARIYNGSGQVDRYAALLASAYKADAGGASPVVLRIGSRGHSVAELQRALGIEVDGKFGPDTLAAVRAHQEREGLPIDGVVGARTWAALRLNPAQAEAPEPAAVPDAFDRRVGQAQKAFAALGAGTATLGGLMDGMGDTAQTLLAGAVGVAVAALAVVFVVGRLRAARTV